MERRGAGEERREEGVKRNGRRSEERGRAWRTGEKEPWRGRSRIAKGVRGEGTRGSALTRAGREGG